jgi:hypothetical protein
VNSGRAGQGRARGCSVAINKFENIPEGLDTITDYRDLPRILVVVDILLLSRYQLVRCGWGAKLPATLYPAIYIWPTAIY